MSFEMILLIIIVAAAAWLYVAYVQVVQKKNKVQEAFASIDVQLKKRYDLLPNILAMANKFMEHERSLIEDCTRLRTEALNTKSDFSTIQEKIKIESELQSKMGQLMVSMENYPQLKSQETMVQAMQTFSEVEEHIAAARRFYNAAILELNNAVEIYPSSIFAGQLGLSVLPYFEITEEKEKAPVNAMEYFK